MNKRILSIALIFIFTFGFFSVFAAEEALSTVSVQVRVIKDLEKTKTIQLVKRGEDLYISPSDLEFVTRYDYVEGHSSGEYAWFFLGHKIVTFYYESKKVSLPDQDTSGTYGGAVEYNGSYYFHLSSALSWLDCSVSEKNNVMTFSPEMITYYELTQENIGLPSMLLDDYLKDGESSFKILAGANALNNLFNFGSAVVNAMTAACNGNNPEYFNKETYINAFIEMANPDYIGGEIAETVFKTVSNIKAADTLLQACGIDLADTDFENQVALFMAEYGLDSSVQNQAYNFIDSVRAFRIAAEVGKYMKPAADAITTFRANMNSLKGYQDALNSLVQYGGKKKDVVFASAKAALTEIKIPFLDIAKNYIGFFAEELSEKVIEGTVGGNLSLITAVAKILFSDEYKSVSAKSKIPVFYDIAATADDMTKNEKAAVKKSDQQNNVNAMLLSVLARRRTLECFLFFKNKLKSTATVNNAIAECDEFIAKLLLVECYGTQLENATEDRPADDTEQSTNQPTDHTGSEGSDDISSNNNSNSVNTNTENKENSENSNHQSSNDETTPPNINTENIEVQTCSNVLYDGVAVVDFKLNNIDYRGIVNSKGEIIYFTQEYISLTSIGKNHGYITGSEKPGIINYETAKITWTEEDVTGKVIGYGDGLLLTYKNKSTISVSEHVYCVIDVTTGKTVSEHTSSAKMPHPQKYKNEIQYDYTHIGDGWFMSKSEDYGVRGDTRLYDSKNNVSYRLDGSISIIGNSFVNGKLHMKTSQSRIEITRINSDGKGIRIDAPYSHQWCFLLDQNGNIESIAEFDAGATGLTVVYKDTEYLQLTDTARQTTYQYSEYPADMIKEVKVYKDYCIVFIRGADSKSYFTLINKQGKQLFEPIKYTDIIFGSSPITLSEDRLIYKEESKMSNLFDVCRIFDLSGKELFSIDYIDSDEVVEFQNGITVNKNKIYDKFGNELAITIK